VPEICAPEGTCRHRFLVPGASEKLIGGEHHSRHHFHKCDGGASGAMQKLSLVPRERSLQLWRSPLFLDFGRVSFKSTNLEDWAIG